MCGVHQCVVRANGQRKQQTGHTHTLLKVRGRGEPLRQKEGEDFRGRGEEDERQRAAVTVSGESLRSRSAASPSI